MNPHINSILAQQHIAELHRDGARERLAHNLAHARTPGRNRRRIARLAVRLVTARA